MIREIINKLEELKKQDWKLSVIFAKWYKKNERWFTI
jgi:hypothetical protein